MESQQKGGQTEKKKIKKSMELVSHFEGSGLLENF